MVVGLKESMVFEKIEDVVASISFSGRAVVDVSNKIFEVVDSVGVASGICVVESKEEIVLEVSERVV